MQEFQFTANTPSGERATAIAGGATLVGVMLLMFVIFDLLLPDLLPSRALFWVVVVVPAIVAFSIVVRRMQHSTLGEYTLRLDGRHLTVICPNQTVIDLGEVQRTAIDRHKGDGKFCHRRQQRPDPSARAQRHRMERPEQRARFPQSCEGSSRHRRRAHSLAQPTRGTQHVPTIYRYLSQSANRVLPRA